MIPPGVVNLVHGGREAVDALLDHPGVDAISFVGQAEHRAAASRPRVRRRPASGCRRSAARRTRWS